MLKPDYTESCSDCIHYTETSYMFGDCELCQHEVACDAICTMYAERQISPEMCREAEKVPVVVEKAGTVTNGDRIRQMTDEEIVEMLCRDRCGMCEGASNEHCGESWFCETGMLAWLKQEVSDERDT